MATKNLPSRFIPVPDFEMNNIMSCLQRALPYISQYPDNETATLLRNETISTIMQLRKRNAIS